MADNALKDETLETKDPLSGRVLEQAEIDGLLKGVNSDEKGIHTLVSTTAVSHERLPMLEVIFDRLMILLSSSLRAFNTDNVDIVLEDSRSMRFKDYMDSIPLPAMINVIQLKQWDTQCIMIMDNPMIYSVVDIFLGGRREQDIDVNDRSYTTIEKSLSEDFIRVILKDLSQAFEPVEALDFEFERIETNPRFAMIERPSNAGVIVRMGILMDGRGGHIEFFIPYSSIEPAREKLLQSFIGEKFGNDKIWETHLGNEVWHTTIEAEAILDQVTVRLSDVLNWKKGTSLPLETFEGASVLIKCGDRKLYSGKVGNVRKRVAIQIEENFLTGGKKS